MNQHDGNMLPDGSRRVPPPRAPLDTRPLPSSPDGSRIHDELPSDSQGVRFRYDWVLRQPSVRGYAVRLPGCDWVCAGTTTPEWASQAEFIAQLGRQLEAELGLDELTRLEVDGHQDRILITITPHQEVLALQLERNANVGALLRTLGSET